MGAERRRHARIDISSIVTLSQLIKISMGKERFVASRAVNISAGGILCDTGSKVERYSRVYLLLSVPEGDGHREIPCEGIVHRASHGSHGRYHVAIEFTAFDDDESREFFTAFVERLLGQGTDAIVDVRRENADQPDPIS